MPEASHLIEVHCISIQCPELFLLWCQFSEICTHCIYQITGKEKSMLATDCNIKHSDCVLPKCHKGKQLKVWLKVTIQRAQQGLASTASISLIMYHEAVYCWVTALQTADLQPASPSRIA